jgi:hypothetical protein
MSLYQGRKRAQARSERIARGELEPLTDVVSKEARTGILQAMVDSVPAAVVDPEPYDLFELPTWDEVGRAVFRQVTRAWKVLDLLHWSHAKKREFGVGPAEEVNSYLLETATTDEIRDLIEAWFLAVEALASPVVARSARTRFAPGSTLSWTKRICPS